MFKGLTSLYRPSFARTVVYMLQATDYQPMAYLRWFWRTDDFDRIMHRRELVMTGPARLLLRVLQLGLILQYTAGLIFLIWAVKSHSYLLAQLALTLIITAPVLWGHLIVIPLLVGRWIIIKPYHWWKVRRSAAAFANHSGIKVAVAGSYGKTTMKEILATVLAEGKKVAATPANKNVGISHAGFIKKLKGDEQILIIEFGEGAPGDVAKFAKNIKPDIGVITGLAPAHLDKYKTLQRAGEDIFSLANYLKDQNIYVNGESEALAPYIKPAHFTYDYKKAAGWAITDTEADAQGLSFTMKKGKNRIYVKSHLLGAHQVGPLAAAAALAHKLGLREDQIEKGLVKIQPFEHRMQPRRAGGALIIDDTYNGNIEGMKAGLALLGGLKAKRKIYVTPGLVDQGKDTHLIHRQLGEVIAAAKPDLVVLMKHSVTPDILDGISRGDFKGQLLIEDDPLHFYNNLDQFVAAGDIILLQNDWTDNYR